MVTTRHQKATSNRRVTRRNQSTVVYNKQRKKKITFQDYDNKLTSLRKKNRDRSISKATTRSSVPIGASNIINNNNTPTQSREKNKRPLRKATRAALESIGKVINYEKKVTNSNTDHDDDSTFISPSDKIQVPVLPPIEDNTFEEENTLTLNDSDIELWQSKRVCKDDDMNKNPSDTDTDTDTNLSIVKTQSERSRTSTMSLRKRTSTNQFTVNIPTMVNESSVLNDDITADEDGSRQTLDKLNDVIKYFGLSKHTITNLPTMNDREYEYDLHTRDIRKWSQMVKISTSCTNHLLSTICPGPSRTILTHDVINRLKKSIKIYDEEKKYKQMFEHLMEQMYCIMKHAKKGSIERRVVKAILSKTMKTSVVKSYCSRFECGDITIGRTKLQSNADYDNLLNGIPVDTKRRARTTNIDELVIKHVVSFILHKDHVVTTSWGEKTFHVGPNEVIILPRLCRKLSAKDMWESYKATIEDQQSGVGRSSFYYLVDDLTVSSKSIVTSVDYVQALLVQEPIEILQEIIDALIPTTEKDKLSQYLTATGSFLKYRYNHHVPIQNDDCATHNLCYILGRNSKFDSTSKTYQKSGLTCTKCKFPFYVCDTIKKHIIDNVTTNTIDSDTNTPTSIVNRTPRIDDAIKVIDECQNKFRLFMGHRARCTNQNKAINSIENKMKTSCMDRKIKGVTAIMIGDFKMKFEPISSRETTVDHYGRRGLSWHGFCLIFYLRQITTDKDGNVKEEPVKYTVYLNQLLSDSNKQDSLSVFSLLDAAMAQIAEELPFITKLILQTDNAKSYSNNFLLCSIPVLNVTYRSKLLAISEFIHTETQDGKTILDAFFARCMKFINNWISKQEKNKVKRIGTATELGKALSHNGGIQNTMIQVLNTNKDHTSKVEKKFVNVTKTLHKYFTRVNHAYFKDHSEDATNNSTLSDKLQNDDTCLDIINDMKFDIGVQSFSHINRIVNFHIDMKLPDAKKMQPEQALLDEIKFLTRNPNGTNDQSTESTENASVPVDRNDLDTAAAALLDLGTNLVDDEDYNDTVHNRINHGEAITIETDKNSDADDDSYNDTAEEFDDDSNFSDEDAVDVNGNDSGQRKIMEADHKVYNTQSFISRVQIQLMLPIGNLTSFDLITRNRTKCNRRFHGNQSRQDSRSKAIRMANHHIQSGDLSVLSSTKDNPILDDSRSFNLDDETVSLFNEGWGRRANSKNNSSSMYGETYIGRYKDKLKEYFQQGHKDSSKKMNAAMMREELKKQFPDVFSIPGETEIKQYISLLFAKSKSTINDADFDTELNDSNINDDIEHVNWIKLLKTIIEQNPTDKPENIYQNLLFSVEEHQRDELPPKGEVKKKIASFKSTVRRRLLRSIVQS